MKYAIIKDEEVSNLVFSEVETPDSEWVVCADEVELGWGYVGGVFIAPVVPPPPPPPPNTTEWFIDLGPFYDRFGSVKMAILTSQDVGVKAVIADLNIRAWVNLKASAVNDGLIYIHYIIPELTTELINTILTTPVDPADNLALRRAFFYI